MPKAIKEILKSIAYTILGIFAFFGYVSLGFYVGDLIGVGWAHAIFTGIPLFSLLVFAVHVSRDP